MYPALGAEVYTTNCIYHLESIHRYTITKRHETGIIGTTIPVKSNLCRSRLRPERCIISVHEVRIFRPCSYPTFNPTFQDQALQGRLPLILKIIREPTASPRSTTCG